VICKIVNLIPYSLFLTVQVSATLSVGVEPLEAQSTGPYVLETRRDLGVSAVGLGLLAAGLLVQSNVQPLTPQEVEALDPANVNGFDRPATKLWSRTASKASNVLVLTVLAAPLALPAIGTEKENVVTLGVMYAETVMLENGIVQLLKGVTERTRPFAYNDDPEVPEEKKLRATARKSFPSGHTSNAFAAAVFLGTTYSRLEPESAARKWVWAGSLAAATSVGYLRYRAGKHFPTDVVTGAIIGASVAYLVPKLHETHAVYLTPSSGGMGFGAVVRF
jgi:hypothetical protein